MRQQEPIERSPLLPRPAQTPDERRISEPKRYGQEMCVLVKGSAPVVIAYALQNSLQTFSVMVVGRYSSEALATAAFSYMFAMATGWLIGLGGTTAIDTLASAGFTGATDKGYLGLLLQRGLIILTIFYAGVAVLWWNTKPIFQFLGQEDYICQQSPIFLRHLIPGGLGYIWFEAMKKYLQSQEIYHAGAFVLCITAPLNIVLNWFLVYKTDLGVNGAPVATGVSYWVSFLLLVAYAAFINGSQCWGGFQLRRAVRDVGAFSSLAILGVMHVGSEWWAFEVVALAAGRLGRTPLAAQSVIMTVDQVINTIPFGLGVVTSSRLGNFLGASKPDDARRTAHASAMLSLVVGIVLLASLMLMRQNLSSIFTSDQDTAELVADVIPYVALFQIADGLNGSCGGTLRGMARQRIGAWVNLVSYYGGALPLGLYLAFHGWGLVGLWVGQCIALYAAGILQWLIVGRRDWYAECRLALGRLQNESNGDTSD